MNTRIDLDVSVRDEVYVEHSKYRIDKIKIFIIQNSYEVAETVAETVVEYSLGFIEGYQPNCVPVTYRRSDFLTKQQYRDKLVDIANTLQEELDED